MSQILVDQFIVENAIGIEKYSESNKNMIRRTIVGLHSWAKNQDEREDELRRKYSKIFGDICNAFYGFRNANPLNTPKACLENALKGIRMRVKTKQDFEEVFVNKFELGQR